MLDRVWDSKKCFGLSTEDFLSSAANRQSNETLLNMTAGKRANIFNKKQAFT
jgi:hypothetical protein